MKQFLTRPMPGGWPPVHGGHNIGVTAGRETLQIVFAAPAVPSLRTPMIVPRDVDRKALPPVWMFR
jgi:hypothetical protein